MKKLSLNTFLLVSFLFLLPVNEASAYGTHSLRGVSGVAVFVENLSNHLTDKQIYLQQINNTLEEKLSASNVEVYEQSQWMNRAGAGFIKIRIVSSVLQDHESVAVYLNFEFYRTVKFLSNMLGKSKISTAATWSTGKLMSCKREELYACVYEGTSELADIFIKDYIEINEIQKKP